MQAILINDTSFGFALVYISIQTKNTDDDDNYFKIMTSLSKETTKISA